MSQSDPEFDETALLEESDAVDAEVDHDLSYENGGDDENDPVSISTPFHRSGVKLCFVNRSWKRLKNE